MERWEQIDNTFLPPIALSGLTDCRNYTVPCTLINATGKAILPSYCHETRVREVQELEEDGTDITETSSTTWDRVVLDI